MRYTSDAATQDEHTAPEAASNLGGASDVGVKRLCIAIARNNHCRSRVNNRLCVGRLVDHDHIRRIVQSGTSKASEGELPVCLHRYVDILYRGYLIQGRVRPAYGELTLAGLGGKRKPKHCLRQRASGGHGLEHGRSMKSRYRSKAQPKQPVRGEIGALHPRGVRRGNAQRLIHRLDTGLDGT